MKEILCQWSGKAFFPQSAEDQEEIVKEFKRNQPTRHKVYTIGAQRARSVPALNLLMACFGEFANNSPVPRYNTKEKAKFACKVALDFRHLDRVGVMPDGTIVFDYRSFSFAELPHMESCNIFNRAYAWMADILGCSVEELIEAAKSNMRGEAR
ncbi:MAG: hypothetical protein PF495_13295 [Spirochaetales bacterium]|jgi:hypothetical protein|nr:hypothetical protein [Spirochaetales bacterium]